MEHVLLGLDLGTGSVKAVLLDRRGETVGRGQASYALVHDDAGAAETPVDAWWRGVRAAVAEAIQAGSYAIAAIGLSGQMHGTVVLDGAGLPVRPAITWADRRAAPLLPAVRDLAAGWSDQLVNPVAPGFMASTLGWLREREPSTMDQIASVLLPKDWLGHRLTGVGGTEPTDASASGLWNFTTGRWHDEFTRSLRIDPKALPPVHSGHDVRGPLVTSVAAELGLPPGIPVAYGRADAAASQLGLGVPPEVGTTTLTMGTGAQLAQVLPQRPEPPAPGLLGLAGPLDGQHYLMAGVFSAGLALDWVRRLWTLSWAELLDRGLSRPGGDPPVFVPFVAGERFVSSDVDLAGSWAGLRASHDRDDLLRAAVAGTLYTVRLARDRLAGDTQAGPIGSCVVGGGGTRDPRLRQLIADVLGLPVLTTGVTDSSARGAAALAAVAAGWCATPAEALALVARASSIVDPDPAVVRAHDREFARFADVVAAQIGPEGTRVA